jgi:hypothetical protein
MLPLYCITILTRTLPCTNNYGTRVSARVVGSDRPPCRTVLGWDHEIGGQENHRAAADATAAKYSATYPARPMTLVAYGDAPDDRGWVYLYRVGDPA